MSNPKSEFGKKTITTYELLERSARAALELQQEDGSFPPGRNGVYDEPETPVRTTSHWLTTLSKVYEITGEEVFADAANDAADYLLSDEARPHGYTFHSRNAKGKDKCDGLVGQAAPIRGLARAGSVLSRPELLETAEEVFLLHPFDRRLYLWERIEIDGKPLSIDRTLNHQLTFAAASANLADQEIVSNRIKEFLDHVSETMRIHQDGVIKHYVRPPIYNVVQSLTSSPRRWNMLMNEIVFHYYSRSTKRRKKEIGYHPVNLKSLAQLKQFFPHHSIWESPTMESIIEFVITNGYSKMKTFQNISYGSMTPGFHIAYALFILDDQNKTELRDWIKRDVKSRFDFERNLLVLNTNDTNFQAAMIYNLSIIPNMTINLP